MKTLILNKTLKILDVLTNADKPVSLKEICEKTGVTSPAASRLLSDLAEAGYIRKVTYRTFEPGLGLLALGQNCMHHDFFPRRAIDFLDAELKKWNLHGALAGMFHERLVYLYHSGQPNPRMAVLSMDQPVSGSNIALVILAFQYGTAEALRILTENLFMRVSDPEERSLCEKSIRKRLAAFEKDHFAVWEESGGVNRNLCFPLAAGSQIYGLSFLTRASEKWDSAVLFLKCSELTARMRKILSKT